MEETLVTIKTAKLAKEKGFNIEVNAFYNTYTALTKHGKHENVSFKDWNNYDEPIGKRGKCYTSAPSQSILQKWLREVHNIVVLPWYNLEKNTWEIHIPNIYYKSDFKEFEEALEIGLQEALKLIK